MKFHKGSKRLYTDKGILIKELDCPNKAIFSDLEIDSKMELHNCKLCGHQIFDTSKMDESHLVTLLKNKPNSCLKISSNQKNITFIDHE